MDHWLHQRQPFIIYFNLNWELLLQVHRTHFELGWPTFILYLQLSLCNEKPNAKTFSDPPLLYCWSTRPTHSSGHCFCTCRPFVRPSVRPSVRPHFSKQNKFQVKTMFTTGETGGLAEWIIDDTCFVFVVSQIVLGQAEKSFQTIYQVRF